MGPSLLGSPRPPATLAQLLGKCRPNLNLEMFVPSGDLYYLTGDKVQVPQTEVVEPTGPRVSHDGRAAQHLGRQVRGPDLRLHVPKS